MLIIVYSKFFRVKFLTFIQAERCQREKLQYASLVINSFSMLNELSPLDHYIGVRSCSNHVVFC